MTERKRGVYTGDLDFDIDEDEQLGGSPPPKATTGEILNDGSLELEEDDEENESLRRL